MSNIPPDYVDLLNEKKAFANLATLMPDGSPQVTPIWIDYDGEHILVNSAKGRLKDRNMEARPQVALSILDPENPYRYLAVRGRVVEITEEGASAHIDSLAQRYMGREKFDGSADEVRRIYKIMPERVLASG